MEHVSQKFFIVVLALLAGQTSAVENYYKCLECFFENREDFAYCDSSTECIGVADLTCADSDKILNYFDCPEVINQEQCSNYTFTSENFNQTEPILVDNVLNAGEGCWMQINRTADGSYGTVAIEYDNQYLYIFDETIPTYESGLELGLIEEATSLGWLPRQFFVANGGLMPTSFKAIYQAGLHGLATSTLLLTSISLAIATMQ